MQSRQLEILTERLIIRPFRETDLREFEKLLKIPEVPGWQMQQGRSAEFLAWHISNYDQMDMVRGIVCFGVFDRAAQVVLGAAGAGEHDDLHETEIFYNLLPEARGHGYATEAVRAVTGWVFQQVAIPYLIATTSVTNLPSQKVLERCGYQLVDERTLLIHIAGKKETFRYYRCYPPER